MASNETTVSMRQPHIAAGYAQERNESLYPQLWDELVCFHSNLGGPASELVPNLGGSTRETHPYGTQVGGIGDPYIDPLVGPAWDNDDTANRYVDTGIDLACANRSFSHFSRARRDSEPWGGVQSVGGACWNGGTSKQWGLTIASGPAIRLAFYSSGNNHHDWNTFGTLSSWESILATYDDPTRVSMLYNKTLSDPHTHSGDMSYTGTLRYYLGQYAGGFEHTGHLSANGFWFRVLDSTEWEILRDDPVAPFRRKVRNYWFVPTGGGGQSEALPVITVSTTTVAPGTQVGGVSEALPAITIPVTTVAPGTQVGGVSEALPVITVPVTTIAPGATTGFAEALPVITVSLSTVAPGTQVGGVSAALPTIDVPVTTVAPGIEYDQTEALPEITVTVTTVAPGASSITLAADATIILPPKATETITEYLVLPKRKGE